MNGFFLPSISEDLKHFLRWFYGHEHFAAYNVEDVLSYIDLAQTRIPKWTGTASLKALRSPMPDYELLLDYIAERLEVTGTPCSKHRELIRRLEPRDSILSLNYNLVCDGALEDLEREPDGSLSEGRLATLASLLGDSMFWGGEPVTLMDREGASGLYLKLHGSIDWLNCPNPGCQNSSRYYSLTTETIKDGQRAGQPCRRCGRLIRRFIVPPVASKILEHEGRLAFLWNLALRELSKARKIVIIGVSFTPSDQELRWLLRQSRALSGFRVSLDLVNPETSHRATALELVSDTDQVRHFSTLDDYLEDRPL